MSFGLPGAVPDSPDRLRPPEVLVLPPPVQDEFKVTAPNGADAASWGLETDEIASITASQMLEAIPKVVQSSLQAHERWHQDCLQCWAARQEGLRKQVLERLEKRLNKRAAGGRVGGKRPEGLRHIDSADSLQTPEELPEEQVPTGSPAASLRWGHPDWSTPIESPTPDNASAIAVREDRGQQELLRQGSFFEVPPTLDESERWIPATHAWARRCFLLLEDSNRYIIGRIISAFMTAVIMLSTVSFVIETMPSVQERPALCLQLLDAGEPLTVSACEPAPPDIFATLELICIVVFTAEYVLRLALCHTDSRFGASYLGRTFYYAVQPLNMIDVAAVAPFYVNLFIDGEEIGAAFRMLRLMRVCRLLKLAKHHQGMMVCAEALVNSGLPLALLFFYDVLFGIIFATLIHTMEGSRYSVDERWTQPQLDPATGLLINATYPTGTFVRPDKWHEGDEPTPFTSIPAALWWVFTTTTTVGYGDMAPTTFLGQSLGVLIFYFGIILLALPISVISANFEHAYERQQMFRRKKHHQVTRSSFMTQMASHSNRPSESRVTFVRSFRDTTVCVPRVRGFRRALFIILNEPNSSLLSLALSYLSFAMIIVTTVSLVLESMPLFNYTPDNCGDPEISVELCKPVPDIAFEYIEVTGTIFFTVEYALRIATAHAATEQELHLSEEEDPDEKLPGWKKTLRYSMQSMNVIDVMAIVPFYLEFFGAAGGWAAVLRVLRLVRVFRVLKSPKMRACVDMILCIVAEALPGIASVFSLTCLVCVMFASFLFFAEGTTYSVTHRPDLYPMGLYIRPTANGLGYEPTPFKSIVHTFWWFFATATTVGYGDHVPTTTAGKLISIAVFYIGIVLVAIKLTIVQGSFRRHYPKWSLHT